MFKRNDSTIEERKRMRKLWRLVPPVAVAVATLGIAACGGSSIQSCQRVSQRLTLSVQLDDLAADVRCDVGISHALS